ncbi:unnamed protein product [marine sediment metagenome]|uniref:Uncharacterized protein n=1 Tax=marine sediment metagenome TaxID=412755 RepID=X1H916_9ZZZZ
MATYAPRNEPDIVHDQLWVAKSDEVILRRFGWNKRIIPRAIRPPNRRISIAHNRGD